MSIIQQPTLFDMQILEQLDIEDKYFEILSPLDFTLLVGLFQKEKSVGAPITVNYEAAIRSLVISFIEGIPDVKSLVNRMKSDVRFKLSLGFLYSDRVPSEATYSRILQTLHQNRQKLIDVNHNLLARIDEEFGILTEDVAIDATAVESHSKPEKTEKREIPSVSDQRSLSTERIKSSLTIDPQ